MKKRLIVLIALAALLWAAQTSPKLGEQLYQLSMAAESRLYGYQEQWVDIGDMPLSIYRGGDADKPAIVLIHGFSADKDTWLRFARHLNQDYQVIIPDLAGHGDTGFDTGWDYRMAAQSRRVSLLLDALDIDQAHIAGNSMGGFITADFALRYPQQTLSLGLIDPAGVTTPTPSPQQRLMEKGENAFFIQNRAQFDSFWAMTMARPPWLPGSVLAYKAEQYLQRRDQLEQIFHAILNSQALDSELDKITQPSLLQWGAEDQLIDVSGVSAWQAGMPQLQVTTWEGIGHMPQLEIPGRSAKRYLQFLQQQSP